MLDRIFMGPNCGAWPVFWRRLFLLTLPVSGPLYVAFVITVAFTALLAVPTRWFAETWRDTNAR